MKPNVMNSTSGTNSNRFKKVVYQYDLISGKVNWVGYQPGQVDAFYHRYIYDAENRLTDVETTKDSIYWNRDASYDYYKHGPLSRMVLGDQRVQGVDYAYTIQGWLKGVNSTAPWNFDMRNDGYSNITPARNAFGFALRYYNGDYTPIGSVRPFAEAGTVPNFRGLYNGNIAAMTVYQPKLANATLPSSVLYNYRYDQLNRLTGMQPSIGLDTSIGQNVWPAMPTLMNHYTESVRYDANGNIQKYNRYGGTGTIMDSLSYTYAPGTNKLTQVSDVVVAASFTGDIDDQGTNNYRYDSIGNLTKDVKEGIDSIYWNVYGKITQIKKANTTIKYTYDAAGNRISKAVINPGQNTVTTWYTRDASGNVMSVYVKNDPTLNNNQLTQSEVHLYGSSRLGIWQPAINVENPIAPDVVIVSNAGNGYFNNFEHGRKLFELSNHLGNVMVTVSDRKFGVEKSNSNKVDYYVADVKSASDYYPFGMQMPFRNYTASNSSYRYGFNGKEKDNEIKGESNQFDYGWRVYDPRVGRFLSYDPLHKEYNDLSPYHFAGNNPIKNLDRDGGEPLDFSWNWQWKRFSVNGGTYIDSRNVPNDPQLGTITVQAVYDEWSDKTWFIHQGNDGKSYYWKHNPGADQTVRMTGNGKWEPFETQEQIQARLGKEVADGMQLTVAYTAAVVLFLTTGEDLTGFIEPKNSKNLSPNDKNFLTSGDYKSMDDQGTVDPKQVRFSQDNAGENFRDGRSVDDLIKGLKDGTIDPTEVEPIRIVERNGDIYSLDNRRLHAFQEAGVDVRYQKVQYDPKKHNRYFSTKNNGESIEIRKKK